MKVTVVMVMLVMLDSSTSLCPQFCQCLWRNSKITVDCGGAGLTSLPGNVEGGTQVLYDHHSDPALASELILILILLLFYN